MGGEGYFGIALHPKIPPSPMAPFPHGPLPPSEKSSDHLIRWVRFIELLQFSTRKNPILQMGEGGPRGEGGILGCNIITKYPQRGGGILGLCSIPKYPSPPEKIDLRIKIHC